MQGSSAEQRCLYPPKCYVLQMLQFMVSVNDIITHLVILQPCWTCQFQTDIPFNQIVHWSSNQMRTSNLWSDSMSSYSIQLIHRIWLWIWLKILRPFNIDQFLCSEPEELRIDFGSDVKLGSSPMRRLYIRNNTAIMAPFNICVEKFSVRPPTPPEKKPGFMPGKRWVNQSATTVPLVDLAG